jgi:hypothetical protein
MSQFEPNSVEEMEAELAAQFRPLEELDSIGEAGMWAYSGASIDDIPPELESVLEESAVVGRELSDYHDALVQEFGSIAVFLEMRFGGGISEEQTLDPDIQEMFQRYEAAFSEFDPDDGTEGMGAAAPVPAPILPGDESRRGARGLVIPKSERELELAPA